MFRGNIFRIQRMYTTHIYCETGLIYAIANFKKMDQLLLHTTGHGLGITQNSCMNVAGADLILTM